MEEKMAKHLAQICLRIFLTVIFLAIASVGAFAYFKNKLDFFQTQISFSADSPAKLDQEIEINFSKPVLPESVKNSLSLNPAESDFELVWSGNNQVLKLKPLKVWQPATNYKIQIDKGYNFWGNSFETKFEFQTESLPQVVSMVPAVGEKNVLLTMEDPIVVNFDRSLEDFNVKFSINPNEEFVSQLNDEGSVVQILPKSELKKGQVYVLQISVKSKKADEGDYQKIFSSSFETRPAEIEKWDDNLDARLMQARDYTAAQIQSGKYIDINLKSQIMTIFEEGRLLDAYLISSGRVGMETPQGSFQIENKAAKPWSGEYKLFMPYWMAILPSGKVGIHELPEWPSGYKEGANHLGTRVSHGCVRLGVGAAQRVYDWAPIGTPVIIHS